MRLFFALWPPHSAVEPLAAMAQACAEQFGGRPTRPETIHLTLAFLGEVSEERLPQLVQSAEGIRHAPFDLSIDRLGYWEHNHLLWAGCKSPLPELQELSEKVWSALREFDFKRDRCGFTPHLTLIRKQPIAGAALGHLPEIKPVQWRCSSFVLVQSRLTKSGSQYQAISEFPLATGAS